MDDAAVLGLWEVIKKYGYFRKQFRETLDEIEKNKNPTPSVDRLSRFQFAPGPRIARESPKRKIIYISPQVWAWNRSYQKDGAFSRSYALHFSFQADLYNESGLRTVFVGHPMVERLRRKIDIERDTI